MSKYRTYISVAFQGIFTDGYNYSDRLSHLPQSFCLFSFFMKEEVKITGNK